MSIWKSIGYSLEATMIDPKSIWIRQENQVSNFPHSLVKVNDSGNIIGFEPADRRCNGSVEGNFFIISLVQAHLDRLREN
jgi:hypothetical protein